MVKFEVYYAAKTRLYWHDTIRRHVANS